MVAEEAEAWNVFDAGGGLGLVFDLMRVEVGGMEAVEEKMVV